MESYRDHSTSWLVFKHNPARHKWYPSLILFTLKLEQNLSVKPEPQNDYTIVLPYTKIPDILQPHPTNLIKHFLVPNNSQIPFFFVFASSWVALKVNIIKSIMFQITLHLVEHIVFNNKAQLQTTTFPILTTWILFPPKKISTKSAP